MLQGVNQKTYDVLARNISLRIYETKHYLSHLHTQNLLLTEFKDYIQGYAQLFNCPWYQS